MPRNRRIIDADYYEDDERPRRSNRSRNVERERRYEDDERSRRYEDDERPRRSGRQKKEELENSDSSNNLGDNLGFDMNNIDFGQIAGILQNVDISKISSILSGFGAGGGLGSLGNLGNLGALGSLLGMGAGSESQRETSRSESIAYSGDRRMDLLHALKPMVSQERANLIDVIIQLYMISKILKR